MSKRTKTTTTKVAKASKLPRKVISPRARTRTKRQLAMALASPASSAPSSPASSAPSSPASSVPSSPVVLTIPASFVAALTPSPPSSPVVTPHSPTAGESLLSSPCLSPLGRRLPDSASTGTTPQAGPQLLAPFTPSLSPLLPDSPGLLAYSTGGSLDSPRPSLPPTETASDGTSYELVRAEPQRTKFKSVIMLNGFQYTKAGSTSKKVTYRCSFYRRKEKCKGRVEFTVEHMGFTNFRAHVCHQGPVVPDVRNVEKAMKDAVDDMVLQNLSMAAERVWESVRDTFYSAEDVAVQGLSREQVRQRVYRVRREYFGGSMHGLVEVPPLSLVQGSTMSFFQFHRVYAHKGSNDTKTERLIGWGHPVIIDKLKYKGVTLFVDGTFRCVPQPFYQCVVIMVHDQASDCFVPAFYVLCSSKESDMYWNVIDHVIQATDQKLNPAKVICDFESGLIKAVLTQFPDAKVSGCYFHFKQALGRQMKKLQIPAPEIKIAMAQGGVDILAVVDKDKVAVQGTAYVRKLIREKCVAEGLTYSYHKWESFWSYFNRQWVRRYDPDLWNVDGMSKQVVARTNNPLERFNGTFKPHPSLPVFVTGIEALARRHVQTLQDIPRNRAKSPRRREKYTLPQKVTLPSK